MATYAQMYGKQSSSDKKYIKWEKVNEALFFRVTGEPYKRPQIDFATKKPKFMVKQATGWKPMVEGTFDESDVDSFPLTEWTIPVVVFQKKDADGNMVEGFEEFAAEWAPNQEQDKKLQDAMLEDTNLEVKEGTIIAVKWVLDEKPRKYVVKLAAGE